MTERLVSADEAREMLDAATDTPWRIGVEGSEGSHIFPDTGDKRIDRKRIA